MRTKIIKCDRCGKELNDESAYKINLPYMGHEYIYGNKLGGKELLRTLDCKCLNLIPQDLCKQCMEELVDWINNK